MKVLKISATSLILSSGKRSFLPCQRKEEMKISFLQKLKLYPLHISFDEDSLSLFLLEITGKPKR